MFCAFPQQVSPKTTRPCGQCIPCKVNKQRKWLARLVLESKLYPETTLFITLTYDEESQPLCTDPESGEILGTLRKSDVQLFVKRLRKRVSSIPSYSLLKQRPVRYYAVGEYGTETGRPHYHLILFGLGFGLAEMIGNAWTDGFSLIRPADPTSMAYTLKYTVKNLTDPDNPWLRGRLPTFAIMSKHPPLGVSFLPEVAKSIKRVAFDSEDNPICPLPTTVRIDGENYPLDRTLRSWLLRELEISGEPRKCEAAYPSIPFVTRSDGEKVKARDAHAKLWRGRKATTVHPV